MLVLNHITRVGQTHRPRPLVELWIRSMLYLYGLGDITVLSHRDCLGANY